MFDYFLKIDDRGRDFPYYNNNPQISRVEWIGLLLSVVLSYTLYILLSSYSEVVASIIFCFVILVPLLYFSGWDYSLIFNRPTLNELAFAVLLFVGYIVYAVVMVFLLDPGVVASSGDVGIVVSYELIFSLLFSIMAEELLKFIPLMFLMRFFYMFSGNRNVSFVFSAIIVLTTFGLLHYHGSVIEVLLIQGFGSIFELVGYVKTKNLFIPYITHLLTDVVLMALSMLL